MTDSKHPVFQSHSLKEFQKLYLTTSSKVEKDMLWRTIDTPFIETIPNDPNSNLVTFLYRQELIPGVDQSSIYLHCDAVGLPFSEKNRLKQKKIYFEDKQEFQNNPLKTDKNEFTIFHRIANHLIRKIQSIIGISTFG